MTTPSQFWSLFKFQTTINPYIWFMPVGFSAPLFFINFGTSLDFMVSPQNLFFVGIIGVTLLAPEIFQGGMAHPAANIGTEFLLTRAVDRPILCRARTAYFLLLVLIVPVIVLLAALPQPPLEIQEYSKAVRQQCLDIFPGSTLVPATKGESHAVLLPGGRQTLGVWNVWLFLMAALAVQVLIFLIHRWKYRLYIFWVVFAAFILGPLSATILGSSKKLSWTEHIFFLFAAHPVLVCLGTLPVAILVQLWCERRFAQMEH